MEEVRWGILGCGAVCEVKSGPPLYKIKGSKLVAVMRRNIEAAQAFAKRHGVLKAYSTASELVNDPDVNAVYIAAPPGSHLELARLVAKAGKPCYVEKPMARNVDETLAIAKLFREADLPLYVAYYRRGQERFRYARDIVRSGKLGQVTSVTCGLQRSLSRSSFYHCLSFSSAVAAPRFISHTPSTDRYCKNGHELEWLAAAAAGGPKAPWRWQPELSGGGLIMDVGCHTLDIIDFIVGPFEARGGVAANVASPGAPMVEDVVSTSLNFENGAVGTALWCFAAGTEDEDMIEIVGTLGSLRLSTFGAEPVALRWKEVEEVKIADAASALEVAKARAQALRDAPIKELQTPFARPEHVQQPLLELIVADLLSGGKAEPKPESGPENALRCARALDEALKGFYGGSRREEFWSKG